MESKLGRSEIFGHVHFDAKKNLTKFWHYQNFSNLPKF